MASSPWSHATPLDSPGFVLWQVTNRWQRAIRAALAPLGLTHVQFVLLASLAWLCDAGQTPTQVELAAHAATDPMMTSEVLRALEAKGWLVRLPHPADRRARQLALTDSGQALADAAVVIVEAADRAFFASAGAALLPALRALLTA